MVKPAARREAVTFFREEFGVSQRKACLMASVHRSTFSYRGQGPRGEALRVRLRELAAERPRYGYRRLHVLLVREGHQVNHKRVHRLYRQEGLAVRRRRRKRVCRDARRPLPRADRINQCWAMDFTGDSLASGRSFRTLNVLDTYSREALAIEVDTSLPGLRVTRVLDRVGSERGFPETVVIDNGPEFIGRALDVWAHQHSVQLHFIRPGKPIENAFIESFNGHFRDECLNQHWFTSLDDARAQVEAWRLDYNQARPHSALGNRTPVEFAGHSEIAAAFPYGHAAAPPALLAEGSLSNQPTTLS
jgi:putative transposase